MGLTKEIMRQLTVPLKDEMITFKGYITLKVAD